MSYMNIFRFYENKPETHEDQLTRAFLLGGRNSIIE